jgi:6-methylsalicylate decarboxylase
VSEAGPRRIDVHHHIFPAEYVRRAEARIVATMNIGAPHKTWSPARTIEEMDKNGVASAIGSVSAPGIWFGDTAEGRALARASNDYGAQMVRDFPGRFGLFASIPLPDVEGSLAEIAYAYDTLKADGIVLMTSYAGRWPGDPAFAPVFEELDRRSAVVFIHPTTPACCEDTLPGVAPAMIEFLTDTTRCITSLMIGGTFSRHRAIRFIFCHTGGTMMVLADRISRNIARQPQWAAAAPEGAVAELRRLYYDVATSTVPANFAALRSWVPLTQVVFGSDYPVIPYAGTLGGLGNLGLSAQELAMINRENALPLFPRLRP